MTIMGSVDISFTNSTKIAKGADQTATTAQETANGAAQTAGQAQETAETASQTATQAAATAAGAAQAAQTAITTANGKNKAYYGSTTPTNPQSGDIWFVEDGNNNVTAIKHYDGTQWVTDVDNTALEQQISAAQAAADNAVTVGQAAQQTAADAEVKGDAAAKAAEEAKDVATKAQSDASSAVTSANNAVSTANQATQDAQNAIDKAQEGFDAAQDALSKAGTAETNSQSALNTASTAAENAQSALTAASNATDIANNAKQVASDAATQASTAKANAQTAMSNAQDAISRAKAANDNANTREKSIIKSNTAPANPPIDQLWIDTSKTPQIMRRWNGTAWIDLSPTQASQIGAVSTTTYTTDISNINNTLSQKASVTTVNTLTGRVDKAETAISQNADAIASKADKTVVDTLKNTVDNHSTLISQNANAIQIKADKSTVDTLTGRVSTAEATLTAQADQIAARITKTDADAKYATQTALTATANSLTSNISAVQTNLDNLTIGGRNLIRNGDFSWGLHAGSTTAPYNWFFWGGAYVWGSQGSGNYNNPGTIYIAHPSLAGGIYQRLNLKPDTKYTIGFESTYEGSLSNVGNHMEFYDSNNNLITHIYFEYDYSKGGRQYFTFTTISDYVFAHFVQNANNPTEADSGFLSTLSYVSLVEGEHGADWTPAPEDMATVVQFNTLSQTLDSTISRIGNAEGDISALQQTANSFATRISNAEGNISTLTQTAQGLQSAVNGKVDVTTYNSFVTQTNSALQSKLSVTDAASTYATQSQLTQTASSLQSTIEKIGQSNLIYNSDLQSSADGWWLNNPEHIYRSTLVKDIYNGTYGIVCNFDNNPNTNDVWDSAVSKAIPAKKGDVFSASVSCYIWAGWDDPNNAFHLTIEGKDASGNRTEWFDTWADKTIGYNRQTLKIENYTVQNDQTVTVNIKLGIKRNGGITYNCPMLVRGTTVGQYMPDGIDKSIISQLSSDINLRVSKNDVINQINISTEGILIDGKKVHITGQTTIDNAVIKDAMIQSMTANKLTAGTIDANVINVKNINASNIVTGTLDASKATVTNIDASKITTGTLDAERIAAGTIDATKLSVSTLSAISANLGSVTAGTLTGVTINAGTFNSSGDRGSLTISQDSITTTKTTVSGSTTTVNHIETFGGSMLFDTQVNSTVIDETLINAGSIVVTALGSTIINGNTITTTNISAANITSNITFNGTVNLTYGSSEVSALVSSGQIQSVSFWSTGASTFNQILTGNLSASRGGAINLNNGDIIGANGIYLNDAANVDGEGLVFPWSTSTNVLDVTQADCLRAYNGRLLLNGDVVHTEKSMMIATGYVVITPSAANTPTYKTISFGKTFPVVPNVVVTPNSTVAGTTVTGWAVTDVTTTGCKIWVTRGNTTDVGIHWIAIADNTAWTANAVG